METMKGETSKSRETGQENKSKEKWNQDDWSKRFPNSGNPGQKSGENSDEERWKIMIAIIDRNFSPRFESDFTWTMQVTADDADLDGLRDGTHPDVHLWPGETGFRLVDLVQTRPDWWTATVRTTR